MIPASSDTRVPVLSQKLNVKFFPVPPLSSGVDGIVTLSSFPSKSRAEPNFPVVAAGQ